MCGRFVLENIDAVFPRFRISDPEDFMGNTKPRYNIAPSHYVYISARIQNNITQSTVSLWSY